MTCRLVVSVAKNKGLAAGTSTLQPPLDRTDLASKSIKNLYSANEGSSEPMKATHLHFLSFTGRFLVGDAPLPWRLELLHTACSMTVSITGQGLVSTFRITFWARAWSDQLPYVSPDGIAGHVGVRSEVRLQLADADRCGGARGHLVGAAGRDQLVQKLLTASKGRQRLSPGDHSRHSAVGAENANYREAPVNILKERCPDKNPGHGGPAI